jgi:hypothetical protein
MNPHLAQYGKFLDDDTKLNLMSIILDAEDGSSLMDLWWCSIDVCSDFSSSLPLNIVISPLKHLLVVMCFLILTLETSNKMFPLATLHLHDVQTGPRNVGLM